MSNLVLNIDDLRAYIRVSSDTSNVAEFTTGLDSTIETYLLPILGQTLLDHLEDYCLIRKETPDIMLDRLRSRILRALWPFQISEIAPELAVSISGMGISVVRTESVAPISDQKLAALRTALYYRGYTEIESLLRYLVSRKPDFPEWSIPENLISHFFNYSDEFTRFVTLTNPALAFNNLKPAIERTENTILAELVGSELVNFLQTQLYDTSASINIRNAIYHCRCIVAYHVAVDELSLQSYHSRIEQAINSLLAILSGNPEQFPGYIAPEPIDDSNLNFFNSIA